MLQLPPLTLWMPSIFLTHIFANYGKPKIQGVAKVDNVSKIFVRLVEGRNFTAAMNVGMMLRH